MNLSSPAFAQEGKIPSIYTCDGDGISPPLSISGVPAEAKSLALVVDDPDVPKTLLPTGLFVHWVLADLAPTTAEISAGVNPATIGTPGLNTSGKPEYAGACPPDREHRYFFKLYALDTRLNFEAAPTKEQVEKAMEGHIIAETSLMGRYERIK
jgi:Raf kinase inhibitor-like YbhB/YbcL family protein